MIQRDQSQGFTLVEWLVVVAIVSTLVAIALRVNSREGVGMWSFLDYC